MAHETNLKKNKSSLSSLSRGYGTFDGRVFIDVNSSQVWVVYVTHSRLLDWIELLIPGIC